jgi:PAS domain S-box-containing protein
MSGPRAIRLLVVAPDPATREGLRERLERQGYAVDGAPGLEEALAAFRADPADVVLLDPGADARGAAAFMDTVHREVPGTSVIVLSASGDLDEALAAFRAGACDFVTMPVEHPEVLEKNIRNCLERRALAQEVDAAESRYFQLIQNLPIVIFALDRDFRLEFINRTCEAVLGFEPAEAVGTPGWFLERIPEPQRDAVRAAFAQCRAGDAPPQDIEFDFEHAKGYLVRLAARPMPCNDVHLPERWRRVEGILMDVTRRAYLDRVMVQREKLNALGALSAELAHEMRNPLVSLGGFARRLAERHPDLPEAAIILEEAKRLEGVLDKIRNYLRPVPTRAEEVHVNAVLTFCQSLTAPRFEREGLRTDVHADPRVAPLVSDQGVLTQVFVSLFNAIRERMRPGDVLEVATGEDARNVEVSFRVHGSDLTVEDPELLFLPFDEDGDRLNLALPYRLVQSVGGLISYDEGQRRSGGVPGFSVHLPKDRCPI